MSEIQIKPEELLAFAEQIGKALTKMEEAETLIQTASAYSSTKTIEKEKTLMLNSLTKYNKELDNAHQLVYFAREEMMITDQGQSAQILSAFGAAYGWPGIKEDLKKWTGGEVTEADQLVLTYLLLQTNVLQNSYALSGQPLNTLLPSPISEEMKAIYKQLFKGPLAATRMKMNKDIQQRRQQQIEWNRKHLHFENGKLVNPLGIEVAKTVKVIDEYGEYSGTYQVYKNGQIAYLEKKTFVKSIPSDRIGGAREEGGELLSDAMDFAPLLSNLKGFGEGVGGKNLITGEKLSDAERAFSLMTVFGGPILKGGGKFLKKGSVVFKVDKGLGKVERVGVKGTGNFVNKNFASRDLLESHFDKHAVKNNEFHGAYNNADEYVQGARDVMSSGTKVGYQYKGETRIGYVKFMGNSRKGEAKFKFVGTNATGDITTYHVKRGEDLWKLLNNNKRDKTINPIE
ncbi:pre-toxin TG domain-containing protein [Metabacillus sp. GX 13764]|uniref:pre-toxin TG domain-containing protein n=1 Tax=Metabacillus kandeliae TaxID=2900151 RepID=UPI001E3C21ED|nr:pre-toxin TG domain-containing protein [Metabacillus kandeliae]MCD7034265.1 pre-toxin TG domain-containing protein [Metabacillus kandeliae]